MDPANGGGLPSSQLTRSGLSETSAVPNTAVASSGSSIGADTWACTITQRPLRFEHERTAQADAPAATPGDAGRSAVKLPTQYATVALSVGAPDGADARCSSARRSPRDELGGWRCRASCHSCSASGPSSVDSSVDHQIGARVRDATRLASCATARRRDRATRPRRGSPCRAACRRPPASGDARTTRARRRGSSDRRRARRARSCAAGSRRCGRTSSRATTARRTSMRRCCPCPSRSGPRGACCGSRNGGVVDRPRSASASAPWRARRRALTSSAATPMRAPPTAGLSMPVRDVGRIVAVVGFLRPPRPGARRAWPRRDRR